MDDKESGEETNTADEEDSDDSMLCGNTGVTVAEERESDDKDDGVSDNGAFLTEDKDTEKVDGAEYDTGTGNDDMGKGADGSELEFDDSCAFCPSVWETVVVKVNKCEVLTGDSVTEADGGNSMAAGDDKGRGARDGG